MKTYKWKGSLPYYGSAELSLPGIINFKSGKNTFVVELRKPNGNRDAWLSDSLIKSSFSSPMVLPEEIIVQYKTNNQPEENRLFIIAHLPDNRYIAEVYVNGELKHKSRCQKATNWQY